jgi:flavin reductase (DIM6/NTAB) family NADH-FMN oxidoreductase RutF
MNKVECDLEAVLDETYNNWSPGLLLTSIGKNGEKNIMTIGWGLTGILFRKPVFMVAVRKSRHTYKLLNENGVFTVNVPGEGLKEAIDFCGEKSGRDYDKFKELNLTAKKGYEVEAPIIEECKIHFECKVVAVTDIKKEDTSKEVLESVYPSGNYHRLYYGEILKIYRDKP